MTTVEKLLLQIFDRKSSIIEQVKQQTDLYTQHLASKSLVQGVTPPSWLWNPNNSESEDLKKEELISKLLRPYPQPSACWSFANYPGYSNVVITGDNLESCDRVHVGNPFFSKGLNRQYDPTIPQLHIDDHVECGLTCSPEPDASVNSPEDQTDERILNIYNAPDKSLAGIKRSKSRQKAIELRSSAKAIAKSSLRCENSSDAVSNQIRFSLSATDHAEQKGELPQLAEPFVVGGQSCEEMNLDEAVHTSRELGQNALKLHSSTKALAKSGQRRESARYIVSSQIRSSLSATYQEGLNEELPQLAEPCAVGSQSCEEMNLDEADCTGREMGTGTSFDIITRSRGCTEVPVSVKGSSTLGCSSNEENAFCHVTKAKRTKSMSLPCSAHADNYIKLSNSTGPSTTCCQSYVDRSIADADFLSRDKEPDVCIGKITRSEISRQRQSCGSDSSEADCSSGNNQAVDIDMMDSGNDLPPECVDGSLVKVNLCNVPNEGCGARESILEDFNRLKERSTFPSCTSIQHNACVDEVSYLDVSSLSAKVNGGILASSCAVSVQVNDSHEVTGLAKPSVGLFRRLTRSQTQPNEEEAYRPVAYNENASFRGEVSISDCRQKSDEEELQNTSSDQSAPVSRGTHNVLHDDKNGSFIMVSELVFHDHVHHSCSSSYYTKQRRELESLAAPTLPASFAFVEPKQFYCKETEEYNLKARTPKSGKRRLDTSPEKMSCSLFVPENDVSLGRGISGGANQLSLGKQSPEMSDVSSEGHKNSGGSLKFDVQEKPDTHAENFGPVKSDTMLNPLEYNTDVGLRCKISEAHHAPDNMLPKISDLPDIQIHPVTLHFEHRLDMKDLEEGNWKSEEKDAGQLVSSTPESKNSRLLNNSSAKEPRAESYDSLINRIEMTNPITLYEIEQFAAQKSQISSCPEGKVHTQHRDSYPGDNALGIHSTVGLQGENSSLERRSRYTCMESWAQIKRRKTEHQKDLNSTSPSSMVKTPFSIQGNPASTCLKTMDVRADTALMEDVNTSTEVGTSPEMNSNLTEGIEPSLLSKHGELTQGGSCYKEKYENKDSRSGINNEQPEVTLLSSLTMKESRNSQGCNLEEIRTSLSNNGLFDARISGDQRCSKHTSNLEKNANSLSSENMNISSTLLEGVQSPKRESGLHAKQSVLSLENEDIQLTDVDQSMPVFEGFTIDAQTDSDELNFATDGFHFEGLPKTTLERASILAEICRSASLDRPSCQFSSAFQGSQNLFQSVPNGCHPNGCHLEHLDLGDTFPLNSDVGKHLQSGSSSSDDYKDAIDGMPYSVSRAYSGARYGWNSRNPHASPVGKLWDRLSSHTGSSGKSLSSNPELTCFPIQEDPNISEENKTVDENAGDVQEEIDSSLANHSDKRQPLQDLTNLGLNMSVSAEEETLNVDGVDFVSTKCVTGTQEKVHRKYWFRNQSGTSKKQTFSTGATDVGKNQPSFIAVNGIKKAKESIINSISKPIVSNKTSLKGQNQKLSLKDSTRNNIVSNVRSFIPLIQQKQEAATCAGKRDVKVKALEAAENAKRLEEKKEIERKLRKEALKLERTKLEEKNLRHMELEKKRKEEERKKKDADIVAKKRLRAEEERKEKEKKRMRLEVRQRQREQEEKKRVEKAEKENQRAKDEQMNNKKGFQNEPKKQQNRETTKGDDVVALQKAGSKLALTGAVMNYEECGASGLSCEAEKAMHTMDKSPRKEDLLSQNSRGNSYEISPYQCSDDEDEEDDWLPAKKYIPSWASKSSVALLLPLQQEIDPDVMFSLESFCRVDEVLLPRKLQKSRVAT